MEDKKGRLDTERERVKGRLKGGQVKKGKERTRGDK